MKIQLITLSPILVKRKAITKCFEVYSSLAVEGVGIEELVFLLKFKTKQSWEC